MTSDTPEAPDADDQPSQAGSGFGNLETAVGGADSVPATPDATPSTEDTVDQGPY